MDPPGDRAAPDPGPGGTASAGWRELATEVSGCVRCPLHLGRTHTVLYRGSERPSTLFIGEAPGKEEDLAGLPFVGRAGRRLDEAVQRVGLAAGEFGVVNLVKCRPPENRFDLAAAAACRPYLDRQLELLDPRRIVTLGAHALRALDPGAPSITVAAGRPRRYGRWPFFPLLHPAAVLHAPAYRTRWNEDLERLREWLRQPSTQTS